MEQLEQWPERTHHGRRDWDKLFDGTIWTLQEGEDFTTILNFRPEVYKRAKAAGIKVKTTTRPSPKGNWSSILVVQALGPREKESSAPEEGPQLEEDGLAGQEAGD